MSNLQPVPLAETAENKEAPVCWINTNEVLQAALQQLLKNKRDQVVLRCDDLPLVYGSAEDLRKLFTCLLRTLCSNAGAAPKQFLHIRCVAEESGGVSKGSGRYFSIQFSTHLSPGADWSKANEDQLTEARFIVQSFNGSLSVSPEQSGGCCLFSVSLPGKFL